MFAGLVPGRPDDKFGMSATYSRFSNSVRAFDHDQIPFSGPPGVERDFEADLELNYSAQIIAGWMAQSVLTYVWHPTADPSRNATVTSVQSI